MAESNTETLLCPCGFFGTSENAGLCSKCYKEHIQRKTAEADGTAPDTNNGAVSTDHLSQALVSAAAAAAAAGSLPVSTKTEKKETTDTTAKTPDTTIKTTTEETKTDPPSEGPSTDSDSSQTSNSTTKRVRESSECDSTNGDKPLQKNKKRCYTCNCKLQPAIREIGRCKCELIFCQLHRLPEQHDCMYDHKGSGRKEARDKMVSPKKHMGTSLKRIDSDS